MFEFQSLGRDAVSQRELYVLELSSFGAAPPRISLPSPHYACLVACDAEAVPAARLLRLCRALLNGGAVYVCTWGPGCERLRDLFCGAARGLSPERADSLTATWHATESLDAALWYWVNLTSPAERYAESCRSALAVCVGIPAWSKRIRKALADLGELDARVAGAAPAA
jgi:hypothetical protein